jgi:hypothetical protein
MDLLDFLLMLLLPLYFQTSFDWELLLEGLIFKYLIQKLKNILFNFKQGCILTQTNNLRVSRLVKKEIFLSEIFSFLVSDDRNYFLEAFFEGEFRMHFYLHYIHFRIQNINNGRSRYTHFFGSGLSLLIVFKNKLVFLKIYIVEGNRLSFFELSLIN